jgi:signal transduction histidine kinase
MSDVVRAAPLIRRRVAAWIGISVFAAVVAAALVLRQLFASALEREFQMSQDGIGALVQSFFRAEVPEYKTVENTLSHVSGEHDFAQSRVRFLRPDGSVFDPLPDAPHVPLTPPVRERSYPLDPLLAPGWTIGVTTSAATLQSSRHRLDWWLGLTTLAAGGVALLAGWLITGRALRPVRVMTESAARMGPGQPDARLPVVDARDELGRLGEKFNALLDRLDGALVQQREFLAVAAHELRTPIARLRSEAEVAALEGVDPKAALRRIEAELAAMATLVDHLLQLARADAMPQGVQTTPTFLDDLVSEALARWQASARARQLTLQIAELEETRALLDPPYAARLIDLLLDNALKYTPAGGRVSVAVTAPDGVPTLTVDDTGPGVPPTEREQVFGRFWRGHDARRLSPEGSGLGLALAHWITEAHGGRIAVSDAPGGGARFTVTFAPAA